VRPDTLSALMSLIELGNSSTVSLPFRTIPGVCPILREYNRLPLLNKSVPSVKNGRFSAIAVQRAQVELDIIEFGLAEIRNQDGVERKSVGNPVFDVEPAFEPLTFW
jgi:hypothetical protein